MPDGEDSYIAVTRPRPVNLLPFFLYRERRLEAHHNARREANVVLVQAEQVGRDVVALKSPRDRADDAIVESSTGGSGERGVRHQAVYAGVAEPKLEFREGTKLPEGGGEARPEHTFKRVDVVAR